MMSRKEEIRRLWKEVFNDSDEYLQLFFSRVYKEENAISLEKNGKVVTVLQMLPYTMTWCGEEIPVSYIYAACTDPEERGQGWMARLLEKTHETMRERGFYLSMLIPASDSLFEFYRRHNYTEVFDYTLASASLPEVSEQLGKLEEAHRKTDSFLLTQPLSSGYTYTDIRQEDATKWFPFFDGMLKRRKAGTLHNPDDMRMLIDDNALAGGRVSGLYNTVGGEPQAMAFTVPSGEGILIKEILATDKTAELFLLQKVMKSFAVESASYRIPARTPDYKRMGMAIILNRDVMISKWIAANPDTSYTEKSLQEMDTPDLTSLLMGYSTREAYMSLMLD